MNSDFSSQAMQVLRPVDRLLMIVQALFAVFWAMSWGEASIVPAMVAAHVIAIFVPVVISRMASGGSRPLTLVRLVYPLIFIGLHWTEAGLIHAELHDSVFDTVVMGWDLALFGVHLQEVWLPAMPYVWLSEIMLLLYFTYYPVVFGSPLPLLYQKRDDATTDLVFRLFLTYMACFVIYLFFPVEGPKMSVGRFDGPHTQGFFYRLVEGLTEAGDSLGTAFPSSHVAGMTALAIAGYKWFGKKTNIVLTSLAIGMTISTVYVQHHFAIDALAGVLLAVLCALVAPYLRRGLMRIPVPHRSARGSA
ncbi:MAG: phosphatase PAP2 family protein [Rhodothermales bacterium]|nr:phosphatase PAP2 family protein [Rhodothermales bacterium]